MMKVSWWLLAAAAIGALHAQTRTPAHLLDWVEAKEVQTPYIDRIRNQLDRLTDFFVRDTSPDIPRDAKHLWIMPSDGKGSCLVSEEARVSEPRWGTGGYILYLVEADTNG